MAGRVFTWPNLISLGRIALVPVFAVALVQGGGAEGGVQARRVALGLFVLMAVSDFLDGWLARRLEWQSPLGAFLDPLADKLLITTSVVLLALPMTAVTGAPVGRLPVWVAAVIIGKDVWISLGAWAVHRLSPSRQLRPGLLGKASTVVQALLVVALLAGPEVDAGLAAVGRATEEVVATATDEGTGESAGQDVVARGQGIYRTFIAGLEWLAAGVAVAATAAYTIRELRAYKSTPRQ